MASASGSFSSRPTNTLRLTVNQGTQSVSGNYTNVSWYLDLIETYGSFVNNPTGSYSININGTTYSGTFPAFAKKTTTRIRSGTTKVTHNADGTKSFNFSASASGVNVIGSASLSGSMSLKTIPRASTATFNGGSSLTAGTAVTITTNRHSTSFTHTITYKFGSATGTISSSAGASVSWTPALTLLSQIPNGTSGTGSITVVTKSGSTTIGTKTTSFTLNAAANVVPTISSLTLTEMEPKISAAGMSGSYVQGVSKLRAVVNAAGVYGSTITSRKFSIGGTELASGSTVDITASGTVTITAEVTDSRGRIGTYSTTISVLSYVPPKVNTAIVRRATSSGAVSDSGTYLRVDLNAAVQSLVVSSSQKNTLRIEVSTKARGTTNWGSPKNTINHSTTSYNSNFLVAGGGVYPISGTFDVKVEVFDKFGMDDSATAIGTSAIFMHWSKTGVGIGKYHENGKLDVAGDIYSSTELNAPRLRLSATSDASVTSTAHGLQIGPTNSTHLKMDVNEIQVVNNNATSILHLNYDGGGIHVGNSSSPIHLNGYVFEPNLPDSTTHTGAAINTITATSWDAVPGMSRTIMNMSQYPLLVRVDYAAWMNATSGELRCGVATSGSPPNSVPGSSSGWGVVMRAYHTYDQRSGFNMLTIPRNTSRTIELQAYGIGSGTKSVNYPVMTITPLRYT